MTDRNNRNSLQDKHPFIKETIKEPPSDRKSVAKKLLLASVCGVLFGACAVATMVLFYPGILQKIEGSTGSTATVTLSPEKNNDEQEKETTENTDRTETQKDDKTGIQQSDALMTDVLSIAEEPRKALVRVAALRKDADLLDDSFREYGDEEDTLFSTDLVGSKEGDGALLNLEGKVVGIIYQSEEEDTDVIRAVPVSQISSLLEVLANRQEICYIGIQGATISKIQSSNLEIPLGIYVNSVEANSPAMSSGIQNGDIIHTLGDTEITTMEEYSKKLQSMSAGTRTTVSLYRRTPSGEYVNVILNISIKEK